MDATTTSVKPPMPKKCGHCLEPICEHASGWLDRLNAALAESRAEIAAKDARIAELEALVVAIESITDENCTETGGIARGALFQIRSKIHHFIALPAVLAAAKGE